jgi:hypothetical protein
MAFAPCPPFNVTGILSEHHYVKVLEAKRFTQLIAENLRKLLWLPARGKRFADAKHSLVTFSVDFCHRRYACAYFGSRRIRPKCFPDSKPHRS